MRATDTAEIGRTGLHVTRLGLGGLALSGAPPATDPERPSPESEAVALIQRSLGLNYLDTAPDVRRRSQRAALWPGVAGHPARPLRAVDQGGPGASPGRAGE